MTQTILSSATGLLTFGTACVCGIVRNRKREEGKNGFMRYGFPVLCAFLLLCAFTVAGSIVLPGEGPVRRAEEIAALAAVFFCAVTDLYDRIIPNAAVLAVFGGSLACAAVQFLTGEAEGLRFRYVDYVRR